MEHRTSEQGAIDHGAVDHGTHKKEENISDFVKKKHAMLKELETELLEPQSLRGKTKPSKPLTAFHPSSPNYNTIDVVGTSAEPSPEGVNLNFTLSPSQRVTHVNGHHGRSVNGRGELGRGEKGTDDLVASTTGKNKNKT